MAFGLTQWLISFIIFLTIMSIITWSAIHLSNRNGISMDIALRFLDVNDSIEWEKIVLNSTPSVIEKTDSLTLFANDQGSEIPDIVQFQKILQTFYTTNSNIVNSANYDITTVFISISNISTLSDNTTMSHISDKTSTLDNHKNVSEKVTERPDHISQTTHPELTYEVKLFDIDKLWNSSRFIGAKLSGLFRDEKNGTSNMSVFTSTRTLSEAKQTDATDQPIIHTMQNGELEISTKNPIK
ncbi:uncharacterized protein LOC105433944 [Pogonomyrmex barbatus]|uniref:Uncharacterized protein LOC105433944 n=1 Tax=Pogonomyrmex barbatus TaxID=144034 RepID=A0A6I9XNX0_9HYME|nr:uncharacterized protein LOC105433944 [Pogonomyrmex barbatus]